MIDKYNIEVTVFNDCFITEIIINGHKLSFEEAQAWANHIIDNWTTTQYNEEE